MAKPAVVLLILDGWGIGRKDYSNPIHVVQPKNIGALKATYRTGALQSSGIAVGLPWGEEGNSEVGHLTLGAGKVIYQHFPKITLAIKDGTFFKNRALLGATAHALANGSALHFAGLLTAGKVHASLDHLAALVALAKKEGVGDVNLHLFSDGKDSPPKSLNDLIRRVETILKEKRVGRIASISGRFYALDRDEHWGRTEKAYGALVGRAPIAENLSAKLAEHYRRGLGDEFMEPILIPPNPRPVRDGDALVFFDFREDSVRQIVGSFVLPDFDKFPTERFKHLYVATMTDYSEAFKVPIAFPNEIVSNPLGKILSDEGKLQLRIAETEKYAHVTYFFNGYRERPFPNEYRVLIPSRNVSSHDAAPEMMAREITTRVVESVKERGFDFILANLANADMVAHTGVYEASLTAVAIVDEAVGRIAEVCLENHTVLCITSDHGNIEQVVDPLTGRSETKHNPNLVPFYLVARGFERPKTETEIEAIEGEAVGILADVAPTILEILGIPKPPDMTGENLLASLR